MREDVLLNVGKYGIMDTEKRKNRMAIDYIDRMNKIIADKRKNGLVGIKFCILPEDGGNATDVQSIARTFCKVEDLRKRGILKSTTPNAL